MTPVPPDGNKVHELRQILEEAQGQLHQQGLLVISLKACRSRARLLERLLLSLVSTGSKLQFLSRFVRQFKHLSRVGLPFLTCLQIITDETKQPLYKQALTELGHDVAKGNRWQKLFLSRIICSPTLGPNDSRCRSSR